MQYLFSSPCIYFFSAILCAFSCQVKREERNQEILFTTTWGPMQSSVAGFVHKLWDMLQRTCVQRTVCLLCVHCSADVQGSNMNGNVSWHYESDYTMECWLASNEAPTLKLRKARSSFKSKYTNTFMHATWLRFKVWLADPYKLVSPAHRCPMPEAVEGRLQKHDLPPRDRKKVQDAVNTYYNLHVKFNRDKDLTTQERWTQFAKILKNALDRNLGEHWHVAVGNSLGYACKVRQRAMGVWKFGSRDDGCVVVIWKSPGIEPQKNEAEAEEAEAEKAEKAEKTKKKTKAKETKDPTVIYHTYSEETTKIVETVCKEVANLDTKDEQLVATTLRKRLTTDFGPIWHILTGSKFVVEPAGNCRNRFCIEAGGMQVLGFQHEQLSTGLLPSLDFATVLKALPYLLMTFLCFAYMGLSSLCKEVPEGQQPDAILGFLKEKLCHENWELSLRTIGVIVIGSAFCLRAMPRSKTLWDSFAPEKQKSCLQQLLPKLASASM